ncbi:type II toxin-antitoxin system RelE/ParE family toxin [Candidatus Peregrinibacteria bacterium]|nr:type II toxin-antitoxin system RelE/ParE family toxin [Candidatus Peregrinibacteria bacterium]
MQDYLKFLKKLPKELRLRVIEAIDQIALGEVANLDVKRLSAEYEVYRCRVDKIRILFQKRGDGNYVLDIGFRGDVYKKLKNLG